jgi:hypothetical protein
MLSTLSEIIQDLLMAAGLVTIVLLGVIFVMVKLPSGSPLKRTLMALCWRLAATVTAAALAIPIEPIPGLDFIYDIGAPIILLVYWISFFKNARRKADRAPEERPHLSRRDCRPDSLARCASPPNAARPDSPVRGRPARSNESRQCAEQCCLGNLPPHVFVPVDRAQATRKRKDD